MTVLKFAEKNGCGCNSADISDKLLTIDQAMDAIGRIAVPVSERRVLPLARACGHVLDEDVVAAVMAPPFDNSAMDGYAVNTADLTGDGPWTLRLQDRIAAGDNRQVTLAPDSAIQIFTGAQVPGGADAIVVQEEVATTSGTIGFKVRPRRGSHIRKTGSDMLAGEIVIAAGTALGPRDIAVVAAAGAETVPVRRNIRVAIVVTGEELETSGGPLNGSQIWDVNTPLLTAAIARPGVEIVEVLHVGDSLPELTRALSRLASAADVIVTTGGVSVGEEDHVHAAMRAAGGKIEFSGVALKPGKPVSAGRVGHACWLGLPGNPVSAFVTWTLFGTHLLRCLRGTAHAGAPHRHVVTDQPVMHRPGRCEMRPARLLGFDVSGREVVSFEPATHSARVKTLAQADGLILIPADTDTLPAGSLVEFFPFAEPCSGKAIP